MVGTNVLSAAASATADPAAGSFLKAVVAYLLVPTSLLQAETPQRGWLAVLLAAYASYLTGFK